MIFLFILPDPHRQTILNSENGLIQYLSFRGFSENLIENCGRADSEI